MPLRPFIAAAFFAILLPLHGGPPVVRLDPAPGADNTVAFQSALDSGAGALFVPAGEWHIGTVRIPSDVTLAFDPGARLVPIPAGIDDQNLLVVTGDRVRIEGLRHDFAWPAPAGRPPAFSPGPVRRLIYADGVNDLVVSGAHVVNSAPRQLIPLEERVRRGRFFNPNGTRYTHLGSYHNQRLLVVANSRHVTLENSTGERLHAMLAATASANVTARGNRMTGGNYLSSFSLGTESFRHHDNWSRDVKYQVSWFGGSPDPSRKAPEVPLGSATVARRDLKPDDEGWNRHTSGAFDVSVQNNYAEYGNTLAWGNKGRQVVIDGNIARFISDYAYGTEGGENIVFSNNIAINSTAGGIVSMYWGEKLLITGNLLITRHEPWDPEWSWWDQPSKYLGPFIRLHHGPSNPEDRYGAGSVHIDGNLFVSELAERSSAVTIQQGRDVTISGNKFVNGRVDKVGGGRLTVMNNEFVSRLPFEDRVINVRGPADTVLVRNNLVRREAPVDLDEAARQADETKAVPYLLFTDEDDAQAAAAGSVASAKEDGPAFAFAPAGAFFGLVQGNFVYGWRQTLALNPARNNRSAVSLVVTGNITDGTLDTGAPGDSVKVGNNTVLPPGLMSP